MPNETSDAVKTVSAETLDFDKAPLFQDLNQIAAANVRIAKQNRSRTVGGKPVDVKTGDVIIGKPGQYTDHFAKGEFEKRYEIDKTDTDYFVSIEQGQLIRFYEPTVFKHPDGTETPVGVGGGAFKSKVDGTIKVYQSEELIKHFARVIDGTLLRPSDPQYKQWLNLIFMDDGSHLMDVLKGHRAKFNSTAREAGDEVAQAARVLGSEIAQEARETGDRILATAEKHVPHILDKGLEGAHRARDGVVNWLSRRRGGPGGGPSAPA